MKLRQTGFYSRAAGADVIPMAMCDGDPAAQAEMLAGSGWQLGWQEGNSPSSNAGVNIVGICMSKSVAHGPPMTPEYSCCGGHAEEDVIHQHHRDFAGCG